MSRPYVAQDDDGGWYGDCHGVMQDPDPNRTEADALRWTLERLIKKCDEYEERHFRPCQTCGREVVVQRITPDLRLHRASEEERSRPR